jgi:hypothetical protein
MNLRPLHITALGLTLLAASLAACAAPEPEADATEPQTEEARPPTDVPSSAQDEPVRAETEVPDTDQEVERVSNPHPENWQDMPVVPVITDTTREIYARGQELGRDPHVFAIIGDCQNVSSHFLGDFDSPEEYSLGSEYAYLQDTIDNFGGSFTADRAAVRGGYNVASVVDITQTNLAHCNWGETALECEVRRSNPSVAIVSMETNFDSKPGEVYERYMRQIVEYFIEQGVVPILATKADNQEGDHTINQAIVEVAWEYDVPLWNFWASVQHLPEGGLVDGFHLSYARPFFDDPDRMQNAWPYRNLTALQSLDAVWRGGNDMESMSTADANG